MLGAVGKFLVSTLFINESVSLFLCAGDWPGSARSWFLAGRMGKEELVESESFSLKSFGLLYLIVSA